MKLHAIALAVILATPILSVPYIDSGSSHGSKLLTRVLTNVDEGASRSSSGYDIDIDSDPDWEAGQPLLPNDHQYSDEDSDKEVLQPLLNGNKPNYLYESLESSKEEDIIENPEIRQLEAMYRGLAISNFISFREHSQELEPLQYTSGDAHGAFRAQARQELQHDPYGLYSKAEARAIAPTSHFFTTDMLRSQLGSITVEDQNAAARSWSDQTEGQEFINGPEVNPYAAIPHADKVEPPKWTGMNGHYTYDPPYPGAVREWYDLSGKPYTLKDPEFDLLHDHTPFVADSPSRKKKRDIISTISFANSQKSTLGRDTAEFQLYHDAYVEVQANISRLLFPYFDTVLNHTNSSFIYDLVWSVYADLTGLGPYIMGPYSKGMHCFDWIEDRYLNGKNITDISIRKNSTIQDRLFTHSVLINIYQIVWTNATTIANATGYLNDMQTLSRYLVPRNISIASPGWNATIPKFDDSYFTVYNRTMHKKVKRRPFLG